MPQANEKGFGATDPEALHTLAEETSKKSVDTFVNPGTPAAPLLTMEDRKTGHISSQADQRLKDRLSNLNY